MNWDKKRLWDSGNQDPEQKHLEWGTDSQGERGVSRMVDGPSKENRSEKRAQGWENKESEEEYQELHAANINWTFFYSISTNATGWMNGFITPLTNKTLASQMFFIHIPVKHEVDTQTCQRGIMGSDIYLFICCVLILKSF